MSSQRLYIPIFEYPEMIQRDIDNVVKCAIEYQGNLVKPTSGALELRDPSGTAISTPSVLIGTDQVAVATIPQVDIDGKPYDHRYKLVWTLDLPDEAADFTFDRRASLVPRRLHPPCSERALLRHRPDLKNLRPSTAPSLQECIEAAWTIILNKLWQDGYDPSKVLESEALFNPLRLLSLSIAFEGMAGGPSGTDTTFADTAENYLRQYEKAWKDVSFPYDNDHDGLHDNYDKRVGIKGTVHLVSADVRDY